MTSPPLMQYIDSDGNLVLRMLEPDDYSRGYLDLLSQLSTVGEISEHQFKKRFKELMTHRDTYFVFVVEDKLKQKLVACVTMFIELKFLHNCSAVGHVEDVVVDQAYRHHKLGKRLMETCKQKAAQFGCYKVILDCTEKVIPFYESCGFERKGVQMRLDL
jgi:glucosamine-phosphate N-acetyltransferase